MMRIMDRNLMNHTSEGVVSMIYLLAGMGFVVRPKRIRRLFRLMSRETLSRRKNLTKAGLREHKRPYLLRNPKIERPKQVWVTDINYIPMPKGFLYLTAVIYVYSRKNSILVPIQQPRRQMVKTGPSGSHPDIRKTGNRIFQPRKTVYIFNLDSLP